jgi:hypothetical protein
LDTASTEAYQSPRGFKGKAIKVKYPSPRNLKSNSLSLDLYVANIDMPTGRNVDQNKAKVEKRQNFTSLI